MNLSWLAQGAGALGGGILDFFSSRATNETNREIAREAGAKNQEMAREQMAFQERMSSSAYERAMSDMRRSGLNPMLAYSQGGASAPPGASGTQPVAEMRDPQPGKIISGMTNSAMAGVRLDNEIKATDSSVALQAAQSEAQKASAAVDVATALRVAADTERTKWETKALATQYPAIKSESDRRRVIADVEKDFAKVDSWSGRIQDWIGSLSSAYSRFRNPFSISEGAMDKALERHIRKGQRQFDKNTKPKGKR